MKKFLTLALAAMVACASFAQSPLNPVKAEKVAKAGLKVNGVSKDVKAVTMKEAKAIQAAKAEKAAAAMQATTTTAKAAKAAPKAASKQVKAPKAVASFKSDRTAFVPVALPMMAPNHADGGPAVVEKDAHGIITSVTGGTTKAYVRAESGTAYFVQNSSMYYGPQSGTLITIEDGDKVYMKDPISRYTQNTWVEGTKTADAIVVPAHQPLTYNDQYATTISLRWGVIAPDGSISAADGNADNFTFAIDGDVLTLQGTQGFETATGDAYFMGALWDDDNTFVGYGDAESVLTYDPNYEEPTTDLVVVPATAEVYDWYLNGGSVSSAAVTPVVNKKIKVAVDGTDIYVQGFSSEYPTAWVKGTMSGNVITFANAQYVGNYGGMYDMYFMGTDGEGLVETTALYDSATETITLNNDILINAALDRIYYLEWYENVVLSENAKEISDEVETGDPIESLPYMADFSSEYDFDQFGIYDANFDGSTWNYDLSGYAKYTYNSVNPGDDYLISPAIKLEAGKPYALTVNAKAYSAYYAERFEVLMGKAPKASTMETTIIEPTDLYTTEDGEYVGEFMVEEDGYYHFGIHAISDADAFYLIVNSMSIEAGADPKAPAAIEDLTVTPGAFGALNATIQFTTPTKSVDGEALPNEEITVNIYHGSTLVKTVSSFPGYERQIFDDAFDTNGNVKFMVICSLGELAGKKAVAEAYVGLDAPQAPEVFTVADAGDHIAFNWSMSPAIGENGGYVDVQEVDYQIWDVVDLIPGLGFYVLNSQLSDNIHAETSYDLPFPCNEGALGQYVFAVLALNEAGECGAYPMAAAYLGAPNEMPAHEGFDGGSVHYDWFIQGVSGIISASLVEEGSVDDYAIELNSEEDAQEGGLITTKFVMTGAENATVSADLYTTSEGATVTLVVEAAGVETALDTYALTDEWATYKWNVADFANEPAVRFHFVANFPEAGSMLFDNFNVIDLYTDNLVAAISAPAKINAGETAAITVKVQNLGENVAEDYVVKVYADDELVDALGGDPLAFYETASMTAYMSTSIFTEAKEVTLTAVVEYAPELKPEDNVDATTLAIVTPSAAKVENLKATVAGSDLVVDWTVPEATFTETVDDFESYEEFAYVQNGEKLGDWTGWDLDEAQMYGWNGGAWPHTQELGAFGIYNPTAIGFDPVELPSGEQTALIMAAVPGTGNPDVAGNDDWMVSPQLPGVAQTISFMVSELTDQYGNEQFQVLVSTTGNTPDCFEIVYEGEASVNWEEVAVNLPEGAKYFAIRNISVDVFGLLIDDAKFTVGAGSPTSFNVYVDQAMVGSTTEKTYTIANGAELAEGNHSVSVTAVYGNAESAPETVVFGDPTAIKNVATSAAKEIYTVNGVRVSEAKKAGVYVVNGQKVIIK